MAFELRKKSRKILKYIKLNDNENSISKNFYAQLKQYSEVLKFNYFFFLTYM